MECKDPKVKPECILTIKAAVESALEPLVEKMEEMNTRMFVDNGRKSFQSSLGNMGVHIRLQWFFIGGIVLTIIGGAIRLWVMGK